MRQFAKFWDNKKFKDAAPIIGRNISAYKKDHVQPRVEPNQKNIHST